MRHPLNHSRLRVLAALLLAVLLGLTWLPESNTRLRLLCLLTGALLYLAVLALLWAHRRLRNGLLLFSLLLVLFTASPSRPVDTASLRQRYLDALRGYEGTEYVWGGENARGIDCSGLVRRGLLWANLQEGLSTLNAGPLREAASLWWFDSSARALRDGYRGQTLPRFPADSINALDASQLQPGDLAVTRDGLHVLAYLGAHQWIEADPEKWRVLLVQAPSPISWFHKPIQLVRWRQLEAASAP